MTQKLGVLILEDNSADFGLLLHEIRRAGFVASYQRAATRAEFMQLVDHGFEIIIADYRLPDFTAIDALSELAARGIDTPFIVVTATLGDEEAARCIRMGATDYLLKDRMHRLGAAITRALEERRRAVVDAQALQETQQRLRDIAEVAADMIWETDSEHRFSFMEGGEGHVAGMPFASLIGTLKWELARIGNDNDANWQDLKAALAAQQPFRHFRYSIRSAIGRRHHISVNAKPYFGRDGRFAGFRGTATEETVAVESLARAQASEQQSRKLAADLAQQHELLRVTLQSIGDGVITTDAAGLVVWLNPVAERLTGWQAAEAAGRPLTEVFRIVNETTRLPAEDPVGLCLAQGKVVGLANHTLLISHTGDEFGIEDSAAPIRSAQGEILGVVLVFHDVTEQRQVSGEMRFRASHDMLTGLLNRAEFDVRLRFLLHKAHTDRSEHTLLFIDLDQFKLVNDTCGHAAGDLLLQQVAKLLMEAVRASDTLARLGGDEFAVILDHCSPEPAQRLAQRICDRLEDSRFVHDTRRFRIGASIGLVPIDQRWPAAAAILHAADDACYAAKQAGRNRVHVWSDTDQAMQTRHGETQLATRLAQALDEDRFVLFAQRIEPLRGEAARQKDAGGGGIHAEVLLRMLEGDGALASPGAFLPAAERFHMASRIDRWVLRRVTDWMGAADSLDRIALLSVNLSGQSVGDRAFHRWAIETLSQAGDAICRRLCLEITETAAVTNLADAAVFIAQVRTIGVRVALDDFGAGASSFGYLKSMPVDFLKIDGQFIRDLVTDALDEAAVRCFADVASVAGMHTVAEFVDSPEVLEKLRLMGIDFAQGFLIHRPQPVEELLMAEMQAKR